VKPSVGVSHGGPTQKRPTTTPWWNSRHASSQPSAKDDELISKSLPSSLSPASSV
jgi:hypothetical protein